MTTQMTPLEELREIMQETTQDIPEITGVRVDNIDGRTANVTLIFFSGKRFSFPTRMPESGGILTLSAFN